MEKRCGLCDFRSTDELEFSAHMRATHGWGAANRPISAAAKWRLIGCLGLAVVLGGPCGVFFLAYNALPPFQISDESGEQSEIHRPVPGTVRYTDGWTVTVGEPQEAGAAAGASRVWVIPITVTNEQTGRYVLSVGVCPPTLDGHAVDVYHQPAAVRALGDIDRVLEIAPGVPTTGRLAVIVPAGTLTAIVKCSWHAKTTATFDLTPYLARRP